MKIVVFGLTISSSWGNGHATLWRGLADLDLVLSYTGGGALDALCQELGARRVAPLYGHVDPDWHRPTEPHDVYRADLSYLGTYAADRQAALEKLFLEPARQRPD